MTIKVNTTGPVEVYTKEEIDRLLSGGSSGGGGTDPDPLPAIVIAKPGITTPGDSKVVGVEMTRRIGTYAPGWTPVSGLWTIAETGEEIGRQARCSSVTVMPAEHVLFAETVTHPTDPRSPYTEASAPFGPFVAATPAPTPTPVPPPAGVRLMTRDEVNEVIASSTGTNEGNIANIDNGGPGWKRGGSVAMGSQWRSLGMPGWAPVYRPVTQYWPYLTLWGVLFNGQGADNEGMWLEVRRAMAQIRYKNGVEFVVVIGPVSSCGGDLFNAALTAPITPVRPITQRPGTEAGSLSIAAVNDASPHFWFNPTGVLVPNVENIDAVVASFEYRVDPRGKTSGKLLVDVGADPKPSRNGNAADGLPWYPGFAVSRAQYAGSDWRRVAASNVLGGIDQPAGRCVTQSSLLQFPPWA